MKFLSLLLSLTLILSSCSSWKPEHFSNEEYVTRLPASETNEIAYYLSIDKFRYYINEYSVALEGKVPDNIISALREITIDDIIKLKLSPATLADAHKYDEAIYQILKSKNLVSGVTKQQLTWNYNFFRNKLNEAFTLTPSKYSIELLSTGGEAATDRELEVEKALYQSDEMTLDSGHYISNRTTRAIFWEAIENDRPIEFHLGDSREFLKSLKAQDGEILFEVRPLAKNYNKIFIVKYPGESTYRYAITNIGGHDRLNHLTNQLSLSNLAGSKLKTKVVVKGDVNKFHDARTEEHVVQLKHLPQADRVIIGQKESIDGKFQIFWKIRALKQLYGDDPDAFSDIDPKLMEKFSKLESGSLETIFKDKKIVEDMYAHFEKYFEENPDKQPAKFKTYNFDNFTIEMCDYIFQDQNGKPVRWRVISNVWGDEIVPIARALKATGHTNVTYMGTAGAFANKGYKVGDLVVPDAVFDGKKKLGVKANWMKMDGAKYGGSVEHVGSPFEETTAWLDAARKRSEFVEVETSYLREIFNGPKDNIEMYLLISDILGSDTETLAHATSSKRKNSQNQLLASLFKRDAGHIPSPVSDLKMAPSEKLRNLIDTVLAKKAASFRYMIFSKLKGSKNVTEDIVLAEAEKAASFTDSFHIKKLVEASEVLTEYRNLFGSDFEIAFNKELIDGSWNPKSDTLSITLLVKDENAVSKLKKLESQVMKKFSKIQKNIEFKFATSVDVENMVKSKLPAKIDPDLLVKIYTYASLRNFGLLKSVTYNGNLTYVTLPTANFTESTDVFETVKVAAKGGNVDKLKFSGSANCNELVLSFLKIIN